MSDIKVQTKLRRKSKGNKSYGISGMQHKSLLKSLKSPKRVKLPGNRRTTSVIATCAPSQCPMEYTIFLAPDNCYYIATNSDLCHIGHPKISANARSVRSNKMEDNEINFVRMSHESGVRDRQIARLLECMRGSNSGTFLTQTILNMNKTAKDMANLACLLDI